MPRNGQDVVFEGWLTKSPPAKRIWRARWRRRWFSLQNSGELPGQYFLTYYTDRKCQKLKGTINLDHCDQVDTGLKFEDNKYKFEYMFNIKTPMRTYYLAADTEEEMKAWVKYICNICGLKATADDEAVTRSINTPPLLYEDKKIEILHDSTKNNIGSPPVSPVSSNPYIPISECITGHLPTQGSQDFFKLLEQNLKNSYYRAVIPRGHNNDTYEMTVPTYLNDINCDADPRFYDSPRHLKVHHSLNKIYKNSEAFGNLTKSDKNINGSPLQSPTSSENVFTDDDWTHNSSADIVTKSNSFTESIGKLSLEDKTVDPPPRPPKSLNVLPSLNYLNLSQTTLNSTKNRDEIIAGDSSNQLGGINDEMYDFPRSHQLEGSESVPTTLSRKHCYNNAAPVNIVGEERVFRYDDIATKPCSSQDDCDAQDEPASPMSQGSSTTTTPYSNLPSPLLPSDMQLMPPPQINRSLKPKRKLSDSLSLSSNEPSSPRPAPCVDRTCKPGITTQGVGMRKAFESDTDYNRRTRTAPRPAPLDNLYGNQQMCSFYEEGYRHKHGRGSDLSRVQYLDLDHTTSQYGISPSKQQPLRSPGASTVYKQVDFMKTEAFNITRQHIEMQRKEPVTSYKK